MSETNEKVAESALKLIHPGEFYEAVGELAEGQAPHPKGWVERLS